MDRLEQLEDDVKDLKTTVSFLRRQIDQLHQEQQACRRPVEVSLQQRGLPVLSQGERGQLLLPHNATAVQRKSFYGCMQRYSFRLFLRDLIRFPQGDSIASLTRYCSQKTARSYLAYLSRMGVVYIYPDKSYRLVQNHISSFGPTLEWYVNEIFQREFLAPSIYNVRLEHTRYGGDYDVISVLAELLLYVEVKSSPPRGVERSAVLAFMNRLQDLQPNMSVFLVDTELRMRDKMVPLFEEALGQEDRNDEDRRVVRLVNEIFHIRHSIYLINSRKGIYSNLRLCVRDFLQWERKTASAALKA